MITLQSASSAFHSHSCHNNHWLTDWRIIFVLQVKPLLQVTNTEEKINQKEAELKQVADRFEKLRFDHEDLEKQHKQVLDEKSALAEQLQAEVELCNEAEEVGVVWIQIVSDELNVFMCIDVEVSQNVYVVLTWVLRSLRRVRPRCIHSPNVEVEVTPLQEVAAAVMCLAEHNER